MDLPLRLSRQLFPKLPLLRRDPHTLLPTTGKRSLALSSDAAQNRDQITRFSCEADAKAYEAMRAELSALRDDVARTWLEEPASITPIFDGLTRWIASTLISLADLPFSFLPPGEED